MVIGPLCGQFLGKCQSREFLYGRNYIFILLNRSGIRQRRFNDNALKLSREGQTAGPVTVRNISEEELCQNQVSVL